MARRAGNRQRRSADEWAAVLQDLEQSGEAVATFCRRRGIHPRTLGWWRWKLRCAGAPRTAAIDLSRLDFEEISIPAAGALRVDGAESARCFVLCWSDGLSLRIPSDFDEVSLRRLLVVLEASGC